MSQCFTTIQKAFTSQRQDAIRVSVLSETTQYETDRSHLFTCEQSKVASDELTYTWQVIDVYKSVPIFTSHMTQDANTLLVPKDTFKYNRYYQVMCHAENAMNAG